MNWSVNEISGVKFLPCVKDPAVNLTSQPSSGPVIPCKFLARYMLNGNIFGCYNGCWKQICRFKNFPNLLFAYCKVCFQYARLILAHGGIKFKFKVFPKRVAHLNSTNPEIYGQIYFFWHFWNFMMMFKAKLAPDYESKRHLQHENIPFFPLSFFLIVIANNGLKSGWHF